MSDYRQLLYTRYVSRFKNSQVEHMQSYLDWCHAKYLPLFGHLSKNSLILDIGCGAGVTLGFLKNEGYLNVEGIDISEEMITIATNAGYNVRVADVFNYLKNEPRQFDLIMAIDFIEHFTKDELLTLIGLIRERLRQDGVLLIQTPNGAGMFAGRVIYGDLTHSTILNPGSLTQLLRHFEFDDITIVEAGPAGTGLRHRLRSILWWAARAVVQLVRMAETGSPNSILTENMICKASKNG